MPNKTISEYIVPNRIQNHINADFQETNHLKYPYVKIEMNAYIGNPK